VIDYTTTVVYSGADRGVSVSQTEVISLCNPAQEKMD
jgi:hypothetical protein